MTLISREDWTDGHTHPPVLERGNDSLLDLGHQLIDTSLHRWRRAGSRFYLTCFGVNYACPVSASVLMAVGGNLGEDLLVGLVGVGTRGEIHYEP